MSDYYHQFLTSMPGAGDEQQQQQQSQHQQQQPPQQPSNINPTSQNAPLQAQHPPGAPVGGVPVPNAYQSLGYFTGFPEPYTSHAPKSQRGRRRSGPGLDPIKHRRTRSGCFTCRNRRVKCDETHPICERCRKGKRECHYPENSTQKGSATSGSKEGSGQSQQTSPDSDSSEEGDEMDRDTKLDPIPDEDEDAETQDAVDQRRPINQEHRTRESSTASPFHALPPTHPGGTAKSSLSPPVSAATSVSPTPPASKIPDLPRQNPGTRPDFSALPSDLQFYLDYFVDNMTHYHYCMLTDSEDFYRTTLPSLALQHEALLYAVVGFAAYHHTLRNPNGEIKDFLKFYNKSVTLLLGFLKKKERNNIGTLLTILQLATIEEYLGDWVNLMGHQKAAMEVLKELFTPQSIMQSSGTATILTWYVRFDVFVGLIGSFETTLPREWFTQNVEGCRARAHAEPSNMYWWLEERSASLRLITVEMSILFGKGARGELTSEDYFAEHARLAEKLREWKARWDEDPVVSEGNMLVTEFPTDSELDPDDIVNPYVPGVLYRPPLFAATLLTCEWHSIVVMHESQGITGAGGTIEEHKLVGLGEHAYGICRIFETIERWPLAPGGSLIIIQACLAIAALFLPRDNRHHGWIRRKFALLETMGYIFPLTMRTRMAELFGDQSCVQWWLPDDEGLSPILKNLRMFADERNATATTAESENLREIRHVFAKMQLGGLSDSPQSDEGSMGGGKGKETLFD